MRSVKKDIEEVIKQLEMHKFNTELEHIKKKTEIDGRASELEKIINTLNKRHTK